VVQQADLDVLIAQIAALEVRVTAASDSQCTPELPHPDRLVFLRQSAGYGYYMCSCGMVYEKNGRGGLREAA